VWTPKSISCYTWGTNNSFEYLKYRWHLHNWLLLIIYHWQSKSSLHGGIALPFQDTQQHLPNDLQTKTLARTHAHLLSRSCHYWKHQRKASFGIFQSLDVAFDLMLCLGAKSAPLRPIVTSGNSQKSLGVRTGEYGGWLMTGKFFWRGACTTSDVWLGALSWCRNHCPCFLSLRLLRTASHNHCETCR
jgi:hypothetical protein